MITQKIHTVAIPIIFACRILIGQTDNPAIEMKSPHSPRCTLSVASSPFKAEIYLDKKPGKRTSPDAYTPELFKNIKKTQIHLTLFKKGYSDTTLLLDLTPAAITTIDISMVPLHVLALPAQEQFLRERFHAKVGKYCIISTPAFIAAGAGLLYYAEKSKKKADEARSYLDKTILQSGPEFDAKKLQYTNETRKRKTELVAGIVMFGMAALDIGAGIVLYF